MSDLGLLAAMLFSEATKNNMDDFKQDATGIAWVAKNRTQRPNRFGETIADVVLAPNQFSGVNGDEWNKFMNNNLDDNEQGYAKEALRVARQVMGGLVDDPTGGADHYYNPDLASPAWGKLTDPKKVKDNEYYYEQKYESPAHNFFKETLKPLSKKESDIRFNDAFKKARAEGLEEFEWRGKRYTTEVKR